MEQIILLSLVAAVATGLVAVTVSALRFPPGMPALARVFLGHLLLFNLLILGGLVLRYVLALPADAGWEHRQTLILGSLALLTALKLGWLSAFLTLTRVLPGRAITKRWKRILGTTVLVAGGVWLALQFAGGNVSRGAGIVLELGVITVPLTACAFLSVHVTGLRKSAYRRSLRVFAVFHAVAFAIMVSALMYGWERADGQTDGIILFNSLLLIAFNAFPLVWLRWFPLRGPATALVGGDRFGLTRREREIVELICTGRTNREIAERLFISPATVKDHNHHIFRKTGVRNRVELVNLFREPAAGVTDGG